MDLYWDVIILTALRTSRVYARIIIAYYIE